MNVFLCTTLSHTLTYCGYHFKVEDQQAIQSKARGRLATDGYVYITHTYTPYTKRVLLTVYSCEYLI